MLIKKIAFLACALAPTIASAQSAPVLVADWAGHYAGVSIGLSHERVKTSATVLKKGYFFGTDAAQVNPEGSKAISGSDFSGSVLWGLNIQDDSLIYGIEIDLTFAKFDAQYVSPTITFLTNTAVDFTVTTKVHSDWVASFRSRWGYAQDQSLYTVSIGPALTQLDYDFTYQDDNTVAGGPRSASAISNQLALGIALGLGYEQKLQDGWAFKADYLYYNFPEAVNTTSSDIFGFPNNGFANKADVEIHTIRIGLTQAF